MATPIASAAEGEEVNPAALVAARELFREATEDVDAGRYAIALEKFKRVASVKETAAVRFNIGRCEESLGHTGSALADFETAEREAKLDPKGEEIEKLAHERAATLRPKVPRLTLLAPGKAPEGLAVTLDGTRLSSATLGVALPIDPGDHVVEANAPGRRTFHAQLQLKAGETKQVQLALDEGAPDTTITESTGGSSRKTWGWVAVGGGVALGAGSLVFLMMQRSAVSDLKDACPQAPKCDPSKQSSNDALVNRANLDSGLAIGLAAGSAVALGVGAYLLLTKPASQTAPAAYVSPTAAGAPAGLTVSGRF